MSRPTSVYVIESNGHTKVGIAVDPRLRRKELASGSPYPMRLIHVRTFPTETAARSIERALHRALRPHKMRGEWFSVAPEIAVELLDAQHEPLPDPANPTRDEMRSILNRVFARSPASVHGEQE